MLTLDTSGDVLTIAAIAAVVGGFAGLTAELIIARGSERETGIFELPGETGHRFVDLGSAAAIPIGILAGVVAAFIFAPGEEQTVNGEMVRQVQLGDLLLISAVAGLSGTTFLAAIQERFAATLKTKQAETKIQSTVAGLMKLKETAKETDRAKKAAKGKRNEIHGKLRRARKQAPPEVLGALREANISELTLGGKELTLDAPFSDEELDDEAAGIVDLVADEATETMSAQMDNEIDMLLNMLDPSAAGARETA